MTTRRVVKRALFFQEYTMNVYKPTYFDTFRCIASNCPDSCCQEWGVQVDEASAAFYRNLPGDLGDRLRQVLVEEDGETVITIENRRCPMWRQDGLCRIQAELGHDALCKTCREFPRLTHDYGDFVEMGLELSCPEAARLILADVTGEQVVTEIDGGEPADYDGDAMNALKATREYALSLLSDPAYAPNQALALLLVYGYQAQQILDGDEPPEFDQARILEQISAMAKTADRMDMFRFFETLEILTPQWAERLKNPGAPLPWTEEFRSLARYFVQRYWLQAVSDYDLVCRVKLMVISCLVIRNLGGDLTQTAQCYSKEIENDADNIDAILDAAYENPVFTDDKLLYLLQ